MSRKEDVIERFCKLSIETAESLFGVGEVPTDCFCHDAVGCEGFCFDGRVLDFIEQAVKEKLEDSGKTQSVSFSLGPKKSQEGLPNF